VGQGGAGVGRGVAGRARKGESGEELKINRGVL